MQTNNIPTVEVQMLIRKPFLDGLKAYFEHDIKLNLIADKFPKELSQHGK